jgi:hypothetical protein
VMVELACTRDLKSLGRNTIWVQLPVAAPKYKGDMMKRNRRREDLRVKELVSVLRRAIVTIQYAYDTTGDQYYKSMIYHLETELNRYEETENGSTDIKTNQE